MEVILLESIRNLGKAGEVVSVKDGFARNFLIPQNKVLRATNQNKAEFETRKASIAKENESKREAAQAVSPKVENKFVTIIRQAGDDGRLFGSVSARDIATEVSGLGVEVGRDQVVLSKPIKYVGVYPERIELHPEVVVKVNVNVARSVEEAKAIQEEFLNPKSKKEEAAEAAPAEAAAEGEQAPEAAADAEEKSAKKGKGKKAKAE